jgi:phage-related protein (TIGR01555 family)
VGIVDRLAGWLSPVPPPAPVDTGARADSIATQGLPDRGQWLDLASEAAQVTYLARQARDRAHATIPLCRRLVEAPATDATRNGWTTVDGDAQDMSADVDRDLAVREALREAIAIARQHGGSATLMVTDGTPDLSQPLGRGETVVSLLVLSPEECQVAEWETSWKSRSVGHARRWSVTLTRDGVSGGVGLVHASRILYMDGLRVAPDTPSPPGRLGYGLSVAEVYWPVLHRLGRAQQAADALATSMSVPWIRMGAAHTARGGDAAVSFRDAIQAMRRGLSVFSLVPLAPGDEVGRMAATVSGFRELVTVHYEAASTIEGYPLTYLVGQPPAGFNTTDDAGRELVRIATSRIQHDRCEPWLLQLYAATLGESVTRAIRFHPLDEPTARERAELSEILARRDATLAAAGIISPDEARARHGEAGETGDLILAAEAVPDEPEDADVEALAARVGEPERADAESYAPPKAAQEAARRALEVRAEKPPSQRGMTATGLARARDLANGRALSEDTVRAMSAWFARHEVDKQGSTWDEQGKGWQAWHGWGGDAARTWADGIVERLDREDD